MNVLFICDGNVARSQEAELFFNATAGKHHATSAGTNPKVGKPIDPMVIQVMSELGFSMKQNYRKAIDTKSAKEVDIIVSFKSPNELPTELAQLDIVRYWSIPDPKGQSIAFHTRVRDDIRAKVAELTAELATK